MNKILVKNLKIRKLQIKDIGNLYLKTINSFAAKQFIEYSSKKKKFKKIDLKNYISLQKDDKVLFLGIFYNKIHIGNIKISFFKLKIFMIGFLVFDGYRGLGIIRKVFKKIFKYNFFRQNNISKIYLGVNKKNKYALKLYNNLGFKKQKKNKLYVLNIKKFI
tara:strand:- start:1183 stop:1668 length:486 start_codon:yes stop_codon:yes gene_type:complete